MSAMNSSALLKHMQAVLQGLCTNTVHSSAKTRITVPSWRCTEYPLAVLAGALGKATGIPHVSFENNITSVLNSCPHMDLRVRVLGMDLRCRYWVSVTAELGSGTSPRLDPMSEKLRGLLRKTHIWLTQLKKTGTSPLTLLTQSYLIA